MFSEPMACSPGSRRRLRHNLELSCVLSVEARLNLCLKVTMSLIF